MGTSIPRTILSGQFGATSSKCMTKYTMQWKQQAVVRTCVGNEKQQLTNEATTDSPSHIPRMCCLFVDEVGCSTSQEGDGARSGEKKIVSK